jgi:hypothetical protein
MKTKVIVDSTKIPDQQPLQLSDLGPGMVFQFRNNSCPTFEEELYLMLDPAPISGRACQAYCLSEGRSAIFGQHEGTVFRVFSELKVSNPIEFKPLPE